MELSKKQFKDIRSRWNAGKPVTSEEKWFYKEWIFENVTGEGSRNDKEISDAITPASVEELNYGTKKKLPSSINPADHKHHKITKKEVYKLLRRSWQLEGRPGVEKVEALMQQFGLPQAGSGADALVGLPEDYHQGQQHRYSRRQGWPDDPFDQSKKNPIPKAVAEATYSEISGNNLKLYNQELSKLSNIDELLDYAEKDLIPNWLRNQKFLDSVGAASDSGNNTNPLEVEIGRQSELINAREQVRIDRAHRQTGQPPNILELIPSNGLSRVVKSLGRRAAGQVIPGVDVAIGAGNVAAQLEAGNTDLAIAEGITTLAGAVPVVGDSLAAVGGTVIDAVTDQRNKLKETNPKQAEEESKEREEGYNAGLSAIGDYASMGGTPF